MPRTRVDAFLDTERAAACFAGVLDSQLMCGVDGGPEVRSLEREFADYVGVSHAIGVASGSAALLASLGALDIGPGDEVVIPAYTFIADLLAVLHRGAQPVFADVDPATYTLDPDDFERRITPRTRAVIVVHLFGYPADLYRILDAAQRHGVRVIEDCCQAHGAELDGRRVGGFGDLACFSFSQGHILSGGTGGAVLTADPELSKAVRRLRFFGVSDIDAIDHDDDRDYDLLGFNLALNEFSAAVVRLQLSRLDEILHARAAVAQALAHELSDVPELETVKFDRPGWRPAHHLLPVRIAADAQFTRHDLARELRIRDIGFLVTYARTLNRVTIAATAHAAPVSLLVAEDYARRTLGLFCAGTVTPDTAGETATAIRDAVAAIR